MSVTLKANVTILRSNKDLEDWDFQVRTRVRGKYSKYGINVLIGEVKRPAESDTKAVEKFEAVSDYIISVIGESIGREQIPHVASIQDDAHAMWTRLHEMNSVYGMDRAIELWSTLFDTRLQETSSHSMSDHVAVLRKIAADLKTLKEDVSDRLLITVLIRSLPETPDWAVFRVAFRADSQNTKLEHVISRLLAEYAGMHRGEFNASGDPVANLGTALAVRGKSATQPRLVAPGSSRAARHVNCFTCGGQGHFQNECPSSTEPSSNASAAVMYANGDGDSFDDGYVAPRAKINVAL